MGTSYDSIGFRCESMADFHEVVRHTMTEGKSVTVPGGRYIHWAPGEGAEVWVQEHNGRVIGSNPHFTGSSRMRARVIRTVRREDMSPLDGAFFAWAGPDAQDAKPGEGVYPFVFDVPDFYCVPHHDLPSIVELQLAGFAHELQAWPNEEAYHAWNRKRTPPVQLLDGKVLRGFSAESVIPLGLFAPEGGGEAPMTALLQLTGRVLASQERLNPVSGKSFAWARIKTLGGELEIVADPRIIDGTLQADGIAQGVFWLTGRLHQGKWPVE